MSIRNKLLNRSAARSGICLLLAAMLLPGGLYADPKKDVTDPVLQEILESFEPRMPRFVDKHGAGVFVADEAVTRASLMFALYEYDKSFKLPKKEYVSKQEFDELRSKIALMERKGGGAGVGGGKLDIMAVINGLQPNMGILLDSSLSSSKVFMDLKNEIDARQTGGASSGNLEALAKTKAELVALVRRVDGIEKAGRGSESASVTSSGYAVEKQDFQDLRSRLAQLERNVEDYGGAAANVDTKNNIVQVQRDLSALSRRLDNLETKGTLQTIAQKDIATKQDLDEVRQTLAQLKKATGHDDVSDITDEMKKSTDLTQKEFARLNRRVDEIERNATFEGKDASGSVRQYASGLAKVALGLGMVAAFFIAR